jgi:hypothetical protein
MITTLESSRLVAFGLLIVMSARSQVSLAELDDRSQHFGSTEATSRGLARKSAVAPVPSEQASLEVPAISPRAPLKEAWTSSHIHFAPELSSAKGTVIGSNDATIGKARAGQIAKGVGKSFKKLL